MEALDTRRFDFAATVQSLVRDKYVLPLELPHHHSTIITDMVKSLSEIDTICSSVSSRYVGLPDATTWVVGTAVERDGYTPRDVPRFGYVYVTPGVFAQDHATIAPWLSVSASARVDFHNRYGRFFSPRLAALFRWRQWTSRISVGQGFFAPTPLTEETEAAGLTRLSIPFPLRSEKGRSVSLDLTRTFGPVSFTATFFGSRIRNPLYVEREAEYELLNLSEPTANVGPELLATYRKAPFTITGSYTFVHSREIYQGSRVDVPLTPQHSAGIVGIWEKENTGRIWLECYYTGRQRLEQNPYREP